MKIWVTNLKYPMTSVSCNFSWNRTVVLELCIVVHNSIEYSRVFFSDQYSHFCGQNHARLPKNRGDKIFSRKSIFFIFSSFEATGLSWEANNCLFLLRYDLKLLQIQCRTWEWRKKLKKWILIIFVCHISILWKKKHFFHWELWIRKNMKKFAFLKTWSPEHLNSAGDHVFRFLKFSFSMQNHNSQWAWVKSFFLMKIHCSTMRSKQLN